MKPRLFFHLSCFLAVIVIPVHALEFRLVSWEGEISDLKYSDGNTQVPVDADEGTLSAPYDYKSPGPLVLYREVVVDGKLVRQPVVTLAIPAEFTEAIVVLAYVDASRTTCVGTWIDDSLESRPPQTVTFWNFSSYPVAIKLGNEEHSISPSGSLTRPTDPAVERVRFKAAAQTLAGWEVFASATQPVRPGMRSLVLLRDGRPDYRGFKELVDMLRFNDYPPRPAPAIASR